MKNKQNGLFLLMAIGEISEKYIAEAKNTRVYTVRRLVLAAASIVLIVSVVLSAVLLFSEPKPAETVTIESDFVLELSLDADGNIMQCRTNSPRGNLVMKDTDFNGLPLSSALSEIADLLIDRESVSQVHNTVLITSTGGSEESAAITIRTQLSERGVSPAVLSTALIENEYDAFSQKNHISRGKAKLISEIASQTDCEIRPLLRLSLCELNLFAQVRSVTFDDIRSQGEADRSMLITEAFAADIAIRNYRVNVSDITGLFYSLDVSRDGLYYAVKIKTADYTCLCLIDAYTGAILKETKSVSILDEDTSSDAASTPLPIPSQNTSYETPGNSSVSDKIPEGNTQNPTQNTTQSSQTQPQNDQETSAAQLQRKTPDMLQKNAHSSDSTEGRRLSVQSLGSVELLSWNTSSKEKLALVYSKEQMKQLIENYSSLRYSPESLQFSGGDLLSDAFYETYAAAVLIVHPNYYYLDDATGNSLHFESVYLSDNILSLNLYDSHESHLYPYAEFIRLDRSDVIDVTALK